MIRKSPLFYYSLFYLTGIYIGNHINCKLEPIIGLSFTLLLLTLFIFYYSYAKKSTRVIIYLQPLLLVTFLLSGLFNMLSSPYAQKNLISSLPLNKEIKELKLSVKKGPRLGENSYSIECYAINFNENIILYSRNKAIFNSICIGDIIIIDYIPKKISNRDNSFDYKSYQAKRRYFTYGYIDENNLKRVEKNNKNLVVKIKLKRENLIENIRDKFGKSEWCDILIALVAGEKSYLEDRTKEIYKAAGALHLMAVSGLHIGFIYYFVLNILAFMGNRGKIKYLKAIIIILAIWSYCAFSGFSSSSVRASLMISILIISQLKSGRYISLNALCASALIITIIQPQSLFNIGFQLSYLALLSILILNPFFNRVSISNNRVIQYCWNIVTISISCQIGTSFITLQNFGYFPIYFMISNLILMPLTAIVLYSFSAITLLGFSSVAENLFSQIIKITIDVMYKTALRIESLPFSIIDVETSTTRKVLFYLVITIIVISIIYSSRKRELKSRCYE